MDLYAGFPITPFHLRITSSARFSAIAIANSPGHILNRRRTILRRPGSNTSFGFGLEPAARELRHLFQWCNSLRPIIRSGSASGKYNPASGNARESASGNARGTIPSRDPICNRAPEHSRRDLSSPRSVSETHPGEHENLRQRPTALQHRAPTEVLHHRIPLALSNSTLASPACACGNRSRLRLVQNLS